MKQRSLLWLILVGTVGYLAWAVWFERHARHVALAHLANQAAIIEHEVWQLDADAIGHYLQLMSHAAPYDSITLRDEHGAILGERPGDAPNGPAAVWDALRLVPRVVLETPIQHGGQVIGTLQATWRCGTVMTEIPALVGLVLVVLALERHLRVNDLKRGLEERVARRTQQLATANSRLQSEVAERKRAEAAERVSHERHRQLFQQSLDGVLVHDLEGRPLDANEAFLRLFGYRREELPRLRLSDLHPPELREQGRELFQRLLAEGRLEFEAERLRKDGTRFLAHVQAVRVDLPGETVVQAVIRDVTQQRRDHEAVKRMAREWATTFDAVNDPIWLMDAEGRILRCNAATERLASQPATALLGRRCCEAICHELMPLADCPLTRAGESRQRARVELEMDGRWMLATVDPVLDEAGELIGSVHILSDITDRKRAETALRESEERFRRAVVGSPVPIMLHADDGSVLQVNDAWRRLTGYAPEEIATIADWTERAYGARADEVRAKIRRLYEMESSRAEGEQVVRSKSGDQMTWEFSSAPLGRLPDGRRVVITVAMDVTARKQAEAERRAMEMQLRQQQKLDSIGTLASGVAHEINNPINGVMNYAEIIRDQTAKESEVHQFAGEIIHETDRVAKIVRNLLTFARQEKQEQAPTCLPEIIEGTLSLIRTIVKRDRIQLEVEVPEELPLVHCCGQQIQQVLMNLLTNGRDALNEKYPGYHDDKRLRVSAASFEHDGEPWVRITVEDHGPGIPPEVQERMYEPFYTTKGRNKGTGLGMAISRSIMEEHRGRLRCETEPGAFTRFHVELPAHRA